MIHPTAIVDLEAVDPSTNVWAYAHVMEGATIGKCVNIGDHVFVEGGAVVGDNVTLKNGVCVWRGVTIESNVFVGPHVTFTNDRHPRSPRMPWAQARYARDENWLAKTRVRSGCSIGAAATICPGIEVGPFSMIAAGSVVTRNVPAFALVGGVPATPMGYVCTCGQPLAGAPQDTTCEACGQTGDARMHLASGMEAFH